MGKEPPRQGVGEPPRLVNKLEQVSSGAVLHDKVVLGRTLDPRVQPHNVDVAQLLMVFHLALKEQFGALV
eukprot:scaffold100470_cov31-Tisochrysis_lutea.AAC.1